MADKEHASAGHKLGQLVGDWFEQYFVLPLLQKVAAALKVYLDHRFRSRTARGDSLTWKDADGNEVDYDFVMELDGTEEALGIPVAFFECFWRRGSRHSKDKARDDSGKLLPMREVYPTPPCPACRWGGYRRQAAADAGSLSDGAISRDRGGR